MITRPALLLALSLVAAVPAAAPAADPMVYGKGDPSPWPRESDAVAAASRNHKILLGSLLPVAGVAADPMVYGKGDPSTWPKELDARTAAARNHRVLLENDKVRVLDVTVAPGEVEAVHSHRWPSVLYFMAAGEFIDRDANGKVIFDSRTLKTPLVFPLAMYKEPEAPHSV